MVSNQTIFGTKSQNLKENTKIKHIINDERNEII